MTTTSTAEADGYPRPDFERAALCWKNLSGPWDFVFDDNDSGLEEGWQFSGISSRADRRTIQVPFVFQCSASGINQTGVHEVLWYERHIEDLRSAEDKESGHRLLLRCGAVDYQATVWLNGHYVGEHRGGHVPFDLDITDAVSLFRNTSSHRLTIRVYDSAFDLTQPRGKQYWGPKPESIFYTPSSGIWQTVWLESVPKARIADSSHGTIIFANDIEKGVIDARIAVMGRRAQQKLAVVLEVRFGGRLVSASHQKELSREEDFVRFEHSMRLSEEQIRRLPSELVHSIPLDDKACW